MTELPKTPWQVISEKLVAEVSLLRKSLEEGGVIPTSTPEPRKELPSVRSANELILAELRAIRALLERAENDLGARAMPLTGLL